MLAQTSVGETPADLVSEEQVTPRSLGFRMPAEWEPHAATWLAFPHHPTDWPGKPEVVPWVFAEVARKLQDGERIRLVVANAAEERRARRIFGDAGVRVAEVEFLRAPTNRSWTRDYMPLFVVRSQAVAALRQRGVQGQRARSHGQGAQRQTPNGKRSGRLSRELGAVKWRFNGWARYRDFADDNAAGNLVANQFADRVWRPSHASPRGPRAIVLEGGAIDVDGEGTLITTESCLLEGPHARNPKLGKEGTERALSEYLGIEKVIWVPRGIAGDDTSGHIDDFVRFVRPGVVVHCESGSKKDADFQPLREARELLKRARDARGRRLELIGLPVPEALYYRGQRLPASYANFYIGNAAVLVPTFNDPADRVALGILGELFDDRPVIGIHAVDLVLGLGTLHCSTMQEPSAT